MISQKEALDLMKMVTQHITYPVTGLTVLR